MVARLDRSCRSTRSPFLSHSAIVSQLPGSILCRFPAVQPSGGSVTMRESGRIKVTLSGILFYASS